MDIEKMICNEDATIKDVMLCINVNCKGTAFITDQSGKMTGIMTDGDIRRLLIEGHGIYEKIEKYVNKQYIYVYQNAPAEHIMAKLNERINIIPVLDKEKHVIDYVEYDKNIHVSLAQPQLTGNEYKYLMDAFLSTWISSTGKYIARFENSFANYCGVKYGVATSNGTTALHLALLALGIGEGDEVIVPDITFAATINAVLYTGATPVIVDIEKDGWCIDCDEVEKAVTEKTKAIIPVHIYGQPCDMGRICQIAKSNNLYIVEDCAEAHGAEWCGQKVGSFGIISCFSFFGNKVVTTGEGGMCITNNPELNDKMRIYRDHGMSKQRKYYHEVIGYNYRMTNLQAAIGTAQVERIDDILSWRKELETKYIEKLSGIKGVVMQPRNLKDRNKIAWLVSILVDKGKRDLLIDKLKENDIDARPFFIPLSEMDIYKQYALECVNSKIISKQGINLPTTFDVSEQAMDRIVEIISENI